MYQTKFKLASFLFLQSNPGTLNYNLSNYWPYVSVNETDCQTSRDVSFIIVLNHSSQLLVMYNNIL